MPSYIPSMCGPDRKSGTPPRCILLSRRRGADRTQGVGGKSRRHMQPVQQIYDLFEKVFALGTAFAVDMTVHLLTACARRCLLFVTARVALDGGITLLRVGAVRMTQVRSIRLHWVVPGFGECLCCFILRASDRVVVNEPLPVLQNMVAPLVKHNIVKKRTKKFCRHQGPEFIRIRRVTWRRPKGIDSRVHISPL